MSRISVRERLLSGATPILNGPEGGAGLAELTELVNKVASGFEQFKAANDDRLKQIEAKGKADPLTEEKVNKINKELGDHSAALDKLIKDVGRLTVGGNVGNSADAEKEIKNAARFYSFIRGENVPADSIKIEDYRGYRNAMGVYLRKGDRATPADIMAALSVGSDPNGGYWVVPERTDVMATRIFESSPIRQIAEVLTIGTDAYEMPTDTNDAVTGGWVSEQASRSETNTPEIGQHRIPVHEQYAEPRITQKLLDDAQFNVEAWLERKIADKMARDENSAFVSGNGVGKPKGFLGYGSAAVTTDDATRAWGKLQYVPTGAAGAFPHVTNEGDDSDCLITIVHKLKPQFRANARWVMSRATAAEVRKLKDNDGNYRWSMGDIQKGQPSTLLGYPVTEAEDMTAIAADSFSIAFGDFMAGYLILDRLGFTVLRDPYTTKGYVKFYSRKRVGGDVQNFDAIKLLKFAAS
jgi:HK97 family phage major capsid protein